MKHVIFDCDNTVGLPGKPMDDALALLYLLGRREEAEILGITCTYANGTAAEVYNSTSMLLQEIGCGHIPLLRGAESGEDPKTEAAGFIVETVNAHPGEVTLVAIGSLTNLYGAYLLDHSVFDKVKQIVLMGGYTAPVLYHGFHLEELNFSVNPVAAECVLNKGHNISILTGNNTLEPSHLPKAEFVEKMSSGSKGARYIAEKCGYRFDDQGNRYGNPVSYCWDVVASVYLLHPELYEDQLTHCFVTRRSMHSGWLGPTDAARDTVILNLPKVKDLTAYREEMYDGWLNFAIREDKK